VLPSQPALHNARRWLDELLIDPAQTIESLAMREHKSERSIRMTVSLAFVSPVLAKAAEQWRAVGLREPIQAELG
jgi:site-specific DNA recombinase